MKMRNIGSPIRRKTTDADGNEVMELVAGRGEVFEPTQDERIRLAYKLQPVRPPSGRRTRDDRAPKKKAAKKAATPDIAPESAPKAPETPSPGEVESTAELDDMKAGRGWYVLPGGERVHGRTKAAKRLAEIRAED